MNEHQFVLSLIAILTSLGLLAVHYKVAIESKMKNLHASFLCQLMSTRVPLTTITELSTCRYFGFNRKGSGVGWFGPWILTISLEPFAEVKSIH